MRYCSVAPRPGSFAATADRARRGQPAKRLRRDPDHQPVSVRALARGSEHTSWQVVRWRGGTKGAMQSRFALMSVRPAHCAHLRVKPREAELLLIEWPPEEFEPPATRSPHYCTAPKLRNWLAWRIERDYQELKDEIGLDHYEGRSWRGFHHHGALCIAAYAFLAAERARLSLPAPLAFLRAAPLPKGFALAEPPVRPERHSPASITTMWMRNARAPIAELLAPGAAATKQVL